VPFPVDEEKDGSEEVKKEAMEENPVEGEEIDGEEAKVK